MLRVRLVGRPSLELDGQAIGWPPGRRAGELLAWLALNPGAHARADLAPRFWPEVLDESARASLRTALHELRRDLGDAGEHVAATRDAVGLDDEAWVDVRELRRALAEGRDDDALSLAGGELLQGIDAEWVYAAREDHRELVGQALGRLSARASAAGDAAAVGLARRRAALDPLAEEPARELMRLLADRGDRAAAMAAYEALRKRMASDLRAAPSPATRELAAELRGSGTGQAIAGGPGPRRLAQRLAEEARRTFVGRAAELESLGELIGERRPAAAVVFISGPGGVGKSRLLHAALDRAGDDVRIASLDCRDVEPTPAGFLAAACEALGAQARDPGAEFVADLIGAGGRRTVLALDTYETFGLMDAWTAPDLPPPAPRAGPDDHRRTRAAGAGVAHEPGLARPAQRDPARLARRPRRRGPAGGPRAVGAACPAGQRLRPRAPPGAGARRRRRARPPRPRARGRPAGIGHRPARGRVPRGPGARDDRGRPRGVAAAPRSTSRCSARSSTASRPGRPTSA